jgi:hypothetical protein
LTSFVQARGVRVEIQGGLFAANIRQQDLNEKAEVEAVRNMVGVLHELFQTSFDYSIEAGNPVATDATNQNWTVPLTITATANENMTRASEYFHSTMQAISLTSKEVEEYKELNKDVYTIGNTSYVLRREDSDNFIGYLYGNLDENYLRLFYLNSGLDRRPGLWPWMSSVEIINEHNFYTLSRVLMEIQMREIITEEYRTLTVPNHDFPQSGKKIATITFNDRRTLDQIGQITGYTIEPMGVWSRVSPSDVTNQTTGRTWMDRNHGALWPAVGYADFGAIGDSYYTLEEAQKACRNDYRLATASEWDDEIQSWSRNDGIGALISNLRLMHSVWHENGQREGKYWSSEMNGPDLYFEGNGTASVSNWNRTRPSWMVVRCIKD